MHYFVNIRNAGIAAGIAFALLGCNSEEPKKKPEEQKKTENKSVAYTGTTQAKPLPQPTNNIPNAKVIKAHCVLSAKGENALFGTVTFMQQQNGVRIIADVAGLTPGKHGFHIHEHGDCSAADASSAGGHFNPTNTKHGGPDSEERHAGDLGNLDADKSGFAHYDRVDTVISLQGPNSIIGKSIVIHADEDDLKTDPAGKSGPRIGCGVITESH